MVFQGSFGDHTLIFCGSFLLECLQGATTDEHDDIQGKFSWPKMIVKKMHGKQGSHGQECLHAMGNGGHIEGPAR